MQDIASFVKEMRMRDGLSLRELAKRSGVSHITLYKWEHGTKPSKIDHIEKVLNALGYNLVILEEP